MSWKEFNDTINDMYFFAENEFISVNYSSTTTIHIRLQWQLFIWDPVLYHSTKHVMLLLSFKSIFDIKFMEYTHKPLFWQE